MIRTDTGAVLYQLSYQAILELVTSWVRNISVDGGECKWIYERPYISTAEKDLKVWLIIAVILTTGIAEILVSNPVQARI